MNDPLLFLFDGQGAFQPGWGKELCRFSDFAAAMERVSDAVGKNLADAAWGRNAAQTPRDNELLQITLFALSRGLMSVIRNQVGERPKRLGFAGHSLGEWFALVESGAITEKEGARLVQLRGRLMEKAGRLTPQDMLVVQGRELGPVKALVSSYKGLSIANHNAPDQIVVSGDVPSLGDFAQALRQKWRMPSRCLGTGVACHSVYLSPVAGEMNDAIEGLEISKTNTPYFSVEAGRELQEPEEIRGFLRTHMLAPVQWTTAQEKFVALGFRRAVEIGPSKILKGLAMKTVPSLNVKTAQEVIQNGLD